MYFGSQPWYVCIGPHDVEVSLTSVNLYNSPTLLPPGLEFDFSLGRAQELLFCRVALFSFLEHLSA